MPRLARLTVAAALLAAVAFGTWAALDALLGRGLVAQVLAVGTALTAGTAAYAAAIAAAGVEEARPIAALLRGRLRRGA